MKKLILASKSPRRAVLLSQIGVPFETINVDVPEVRGDGESPETYVLRLAGDKSAAGAALYPGRVVLGADTVVESGGKVLEKPRDKQHCIEMLMTLSNATHRVLTAVALTHNSQRSVLLNKTEVVFREITPQEADAYWETGEPRDKAGGYGIQGFGGVFVSAIHGSYSAVVGLPLFETQRLLQAFAVPIWIKNE